ncbi:hypothetical protein I302_106548 [Kwoniella bestiolae CBS 10118]|uniref:Uncharacterized protein n=1 Tax=Kwoniella bestiolae CBS 10118 TaxID=1296100 RepID=A0A1B9G140_9TREE|nr:hypothetical protein I302_06190 [Kwoniella bestiolae CBS 10118]OCF24729.1 hypothetical protein I302_06190 [Kwoniella bestiolae CBS 10118]
MSTSILPAPHNLPHADPLLSYVDPHPELELEQEQEASESISESEQSISSSAYLADLNYKIKWFGLFALEDDFWWDFWLLVRYQKAEFLEERGEVYSWGHDDGEGTEDTTSSLGGYLAEGEDYEGESLEGEDQEGVFEYLRVTNQSISKEERSGRIEGWINTQIEGPTTQGHIGSSEPVTRKRTSAQSEQTDKRYEGPRKVKVGRINPSREETLGRIQSWLNTIGLARTSPAAGFHIEQRTIEHIEPSRPITRKRTSAQVDHKIVEGQGPSKLKIRKI